MKWLGWWHHAPQRIREFPVWWSHFVLVSVICSGIWFLCCCFFGQGRLIHHQPSATLHFDVYLCIFFNWTEALLSVFCWIYSRDCPYKYLVCFCCFFFLVSVPFCFLQFASIALCLISRMRLRGGWSTFFFKRRGCAICTVFLIGQKYGKNTLY